jgi:hypothetical protein
MTTSESIAKISAALVGFHRAVGKIGKDANNPFFKSKYASLPNILDGIQEPLVNNGLALVQFPEGDGGLTTRLCHESGEWMEATYYMKGKSDSPQDKGSAITYQRRYAVGAILSLSIDEDDDGNAASPAPATNGQQAAKDTDTRPWLNKGTKEYNGTLLKLAEGKTDLKTVQQFFKLNKEVKAELEKAMQNA